MSKSKQQDANNIEKQAPVLTRLPEGLTLVGNGLSLCCDFRELLPRVKQSNLQGEILVKAARVKGTDPKEITVLDATAGLGEDSFLLAAAGFRVILFERDEAIGALLEDGICRALEDDALKEIAARMEFRKGDSISGMKESQADVVYLDPMFPARKKSGMIGKKFQLLQLLENPCSQEEELLQAALSCAKKKVMIKRPAKGPYLADQKPDYSYEGKAIRVDVILQHP